jgi:carbonic anhydrase/acetyltransferase-like protein (isoleucine patch superfamily)
MPILPFNNSKPRIAPDVFIAPGAMIIGDVTIHGGASVWYNAVIRGDSAAIVIGARSNIQDNATLHVDGDAPLTIGEDCTVGHNAVVHGAALADRVLVGMNAVVLSHANIGPDTIIGAGALVSEHKDIPSGSLVIGLPAKVARVLNADEQQSIVKSAAGYCERARAHQRSLGMSAG